MKNKLILVVIIAVVGLAACNQVKLDQASTNVRSIGEDQAYTSSLTNPQLTERGLNRVDKPRIDKRYALVIGNANYTGDRNIKPLKNPLHDARDMRDALKSVGFEVIYRENVPNGEQMERAVEKFTQKLENGGVGLFFYAGHGVQAQGINYLIPTRVSIPTQIELKHRAMRAEYVLEKMEYARNGMNIIILDACRNNPLPARGRSASKTGLAKMDNPSGSILIFATAAGDTAYDGKGRNGVFTKHLLRGIKNYGDLPVEAMLKKVRIAVEQETIDEPVPQIPWQNSSLKRDFCFSPSGCFDPAAEARQQIEQAELARKQAEERARQQIEQVELARKQAEEQARQQIEQAELAKQQAEERVRKARIEVEEAKRQAEETAKQEKATYSNSPRIDEAAILEAARIIQESKQRTKQAEQAAELARQAQIKSEQLARQAQIDAERRIQQAERKAREAAAVQPRPSSQQSSQPVFVAPAF